MTCQDCLTNDGYYRNHIDEYMLNESVRMLCNTCATKYMASGRMPRAPLEFEIPLTHEDCVCITNALSRLNRLFPEEIELHNRLMRTFS